MDTSVKIENLKIETIEHVTHPDGTDSWVEVYTDSPGKVRRRLVRAGPYLEDVVEGLVKSKTIINSDGDELECFEVRKGIAGLQLEMVDDGDTFEMTREDARKLRKWLSRWIKQGEE